MAQHRDGLVTPRNQLIITMPSSECRAQEFPRGSRSSLVAWKPKPNPPHAPISPIQRNYAQKPKAVYPVFYGCALSKSLGLGKGDKPDLRRAFVPLPGDCKPDSDRKSVV